MQITVTQASATSSTTLWETLRDLQSWPQWCPTFTSVQPDGPFEVGTLARVVQPQLRPAVWRIQEIVPGRSFRWSTSGPGFVMVADHVLEPVGSGTSIQLPLLLTGVMAWAVALMAGGTMRSYLRQEARALAGRPNPAA